MQRREGRKLGAGRRPWALAGAAAVLTAGMVAAALGVASAKGTYAKSSWWEPGQGALMPAVLDFKNPRGTLGVINAGGAFPTKGHPFFTPLGTNGRACVSCHQPSDGMSLSAQTVQQRWQATQGHDPIFAAFDGSNCPSLPQELKSSHSLLLERGVFRVAEPWPPKDSQGRTVKPEFRIEVVRDPTGCNTSPVYGLNSPTPMVSVFRRPRVAGNLKYVTNAGGGFNAKNLAMTMPLDPDTGKPVGLNFMADARELTLKTQAISAVLGHEQGATAPSAEQLRKIVDFEMQVYVAQKGDNVGGPLQYKGGPPALGPEAMRDGQQGVLADYLDNPVFKSFAMWKASAPGETPKQRAFRASVARGFDIFFVRPFWIRDVQHINTVGLGNPAKRTCATCHNTSLTGQDLSAGWVDLGTANSPWSNDAPDLPLFKVTCDEAAAPHTFLGRVIYTHDPGRALVTGRCIDVGSIVMQQFRGLAARAPYFSNGSARSLNELVDYYDRRFNIGFSDQERADLVNFLSVL
ncbi:MAG: hypothetical protein ACXU82_00705 [Caulobacteraceae bacterium]